MQKYFRRALFEHVAKCIEWMYWVSMNAKRPQNNSQLRRITHPFMHFFCCQILISQTESSYANQCKYIAKHKSWFRNWKHRWLLIAWNTAIRDAACKYTKNNNNKWWNWHECARAWIYSRIFEHCIPALVSPLSNRTTMDFVSTSERLRRRCAIILCAVCSALWNVLHLT